VTLKCLMSPIVLLSLASLAAGCSSSSPATRPDNAFGGNTGTGGTGSTPPGSGGGSGSTDIVGAGGTTPPIGGGGTGDPTCDSVLDMVIRDFRAGPDFEAAYLGDVVRRQLVQPVLGPDNKPVFKSGIGCPWKEGTPLDCDTWMTFTPVITSADTFKQWYNTTDGVNMEFKKQIDLVESPPGSGQYVYDTSAFFPLGPNEGFGITPPGNQLKQNFLFTTEIHVQFGYAKGQKFTFRGDDDLWIFINKRLALDLGSLHLAAEGTIDFDAQAAALGIAPGQTYAMDIFHAERHTNGSNFKVTTNISCFSPPTAVN
jgi:fibro-slime domain-containing protein